MPGYASFMLRKKRRDTRRAKKAHERSTRRPTLRRLPSSGRTSPWRYGDPWPRPVTPRPSSRGRMSRKSRRSRRSKGK